MRTLARDVSKTCERNPNACEAGGDTITLLKLKAETGIDIILGAISTYRDLPNDGTLTDQDLIADWAASSDPD